MALETLVTTVTPVFCFGNNLRGQLGNGSNANEFAVVPAEVQSSDTFVDISVGQSFTCGVTTDGFVKCWGINNLGQLGLGQGVGPGGVVDTPNRPEARVAGISKVIKIFSAGDRSCAIVEGDRPFCWGNNSQGSLGFPEGPVFDEPKPVTAIHKAASVSMSKHRTFYIEASGKVWDAGQRTSRTSVAPETPIMIPGIGSFYPD